MIMVILLKRCLLGLSLLNLYMMFFLNLVDLDIRSTRKQWLWGQFKPRRPRYTEHKETMALGSIPIVINKTLEIEIKLNYEQVLAAEDEELKRIVASEVLNTFQNLKVPKKVTDFDKDRFVADIDRLFHQKFLK